MLSKFSSRAPKPMPKMESAQPVEQTKPSQEPVVEKKSEKHVILENKMCENMCDDCKNELSLCKLCAKKAKIRCLCFHDASGEHLCVDHLDAKRADVEELKANDICAQMVSSKSVHALSSNSNDLCAQRANIGDLCVKNLRVENWQNCNKYRATAVLSADTLYTLGSNINFDVVLDDPNGNVSVGPFSYTAPKSGYYQLSVDIDMNGLTGAASILGTPVARLQTIVNGVDFSDVLCPFLAFSDDQTSMLSFLALLNAGDVLQTKLDVLVLNQVSGLMNYVGTVILEGNGTFPSQCSFGIILLSELCQGTPVTCQTCPPVEVPCEPVLVTCGAPCHRQEPNGSSMDDCESCQ